MHQSPFLFPLESDRPSADRLDSPGRLGSQTTLAGEYIGGTVGTSLSCRPGSVGMSERWTHSSHAIWTGERDGEDGDRIVGPSKEML